MLQYPVYDIQRMSTKDGPGLRTTVFLKGCPLRCLWCSNPESQAFKPQLMVFENLCTGCGQCLQICPAKAVEKQGEIFNRNLALCTDCGLCAPACPARARVLSGKYMNVPEVMEVVRKDALFYANSDGGVTIGGGEPTAAGDFLLELLRACRDEAFHVCVDTCGFCPPANFEKVIELTDLLLFDCKHMDPEQHKHLTGQDNVFILKNLHVALASRTQVRIRIPLMPGLNDSEKNIRALADLLHGYKVDEVDILPYHAFGRNKYMALRKQYPDIRAYEDAELQTVLHRFANYGLKVELIS